MLFIRAVPEFLVDHCRQTHIDRFLYRIENLFKISQPIHRWFWVVEYRF